MCSIPFGTGLRAFASEYYLIKRKGDDLGAEGRLDESARPAWAAAAAAAQGSSWSMRKANNMPRSSVLSRAPVLGTPGLSVPTRMVEPTNEKTKSGEVDKTSAAAFCRDLRLPRR